MLPKKVKGDMEHEGFRDRPSDPVGKYGPKEKIEIMEPDDAHQKIAKELLKEDGNPAEKIFAEYDEQPGELLTSQGRADRNFFHHIIEELNNRIKKHNHSSWIRDPPPRVRDFLQLLVIKHPKILSQGQEYENHIRPLKQALKKFKPLAFDVISLIMSDEDLRALNEGCPLHLSQVKPFCYGVVIDNLKINCQLEALLATSVCATTLSGRMSETIRKFGKYDYFRPAMDAIVQAGKAEICPLAKVKLPPRLKERFQKSDTPAKGACPHVWLDVDGLLTWAQGFRGELAKALELQEEDKQADESWLHLLFEDETPFQALNPGGALPLSRENFRNLIQLYPNPKDAKDPKDLKDRKDSCIFIKRDKQGRIPLHRAIELYGKTDLDFGLLYDVIELLVRRSPNSIDEEITKDNQGVPSITPYRRLKQLQRQDSTKPKEGRKASIEKAERLLRHVCIGKQDKSKTWKQKYLYESLAAGELDDRRFALFKVVTVADCGTAPEIHLDLAQVKVPVADYMAFRAKRIKARLDKTLEYISLPRYEPGNFLQQQMKDTTESPQKNSEDSSTTVEEAELLKRNPYTAIFEWLREESRAVDKIFRVSVEDSGETQHTDEGIQKMLEPFDVEIWDWRRNDISSDTILKGAKNTRELHLYWSGNKAVMRSWGCEHGLALLKKASLGGASGAVSGKLTLL
jgi:hypothetical protein